MKKVKTSGGIVTLLLILFSNGFSQVTVTFNADMLALTRDELFSGMNG